MLLYYAYCLLQHLYLSLIGSIIIVVGLYSLVWGKSKDPKGSSTTPTEDEKSIKHALPIKDTTKTIIVITDIKGQQEMPNIAATQTS